MLDFYDTVTQTWNWIFFWFSILGGVFFGVYVFYKGDAESSWRDILGWGVAVYLTFITLANLYRFISGSPDWAVNLHNGTARWFGFIFTIIIVAGTLRWLKYRKDKDDRLP